MVQNLAIFVTTGLADQLGSLQSNQKPQDKACGAALKTMSRDACITTHLLLLHLHPLGALPYEAQQLVLSCCLTTAKLHHRTKYSQSSNCYKTAAAQEKEGKQCRGKP